MLNPYWLITNDRQQQQTFRLISILLIRNKYNMNESLYEQIHSDFTSDHFFYGAFILKLS